jgi:hypothetical protein
MEMRQKFPRLGIWIPENEILMPVSEEIHVELSDAAIAALRDARGVLEDKLDDFIGQYTAHLLCLKVRPTSLNTAHLARSQRRYLRALFDARFDKEYLQTLREIGHEYHLLGMDVRSCLRISSLYLDFFMPLLRAKFAGDEIKQCHVQLAFRKVMLLDMSVLLEAYDRSEDLAQASRAGVIVKPESQLLFDKRTRPVLN